MTHQVEKLLEILNSEGVSKEEIICIFQCGSSLFFEDAGDVDYMVFTKDRHLYSLNHEIDGKEIDIVPHTLDEWNNEILKREYEPYFLDECPHRILVYGDDSKIKKYDPLTDYKVRKTIMQFYANRLFCKNRNLKEKRLWCFLRFAFAIKNGKHEFTDFQLKEMNKARLGKISVEKYRPLFDELNYQILGGKRL